MRVTAPSKIRKRNAECKNMGLCFPLYWDFKNRRPKLHRYQKVKVSYLEATVFTHTVISSAIIRFTPCLHGKEKQRNRNCHLPNSFALKIRFVKKVLKVMAKPITCIREMRTVLLNKGKWVGSFIPKSGVNGTVFQPKEPKKKPQQLKNFKFDRHQTFKKYIFIILSPHIGPNM